MKKLFGFVVILSVLAIAGCKSRTPEEIKCGKMMEHMYNVTIDSPKLKDLHEAERRELIETLKGEFESKRSASVKECAKEFNETTYNCLMNAGTTADFAKCNN
jgi:hypothetical protein